MSSEENNTDEESWSLLAGTEAVYSVSTHGRVRKNRHIKVDSNGVETTYPEKVLKESSKDGGWHCVTLLLPSGKRRKVPVHELVLEQFVGGKPLTVRSPQGRILNGSVRIRGGHLDGDFTNNRLDNLAWMGVGEQTARRLGYLNGREVSGG